VRRLADIAMAIEKMNIRYESISSLIEPINVLFGALLITAGLVYVALNPVDLPLVLFFLVMASRLQPRFSELDSSRHEIVTLYPDVKRLFWLQGHALDDTPTSSLNESDYEDVKASEDLTTLAKIDPVAAVLEELGGAEFGLAIEKENQENQPVSTLTSRSEPSAAVEVRDLQYAYATQSALFESASLSVKPGEFLAITGASGIGKSTFIELLLGLRVPGSGSIEINGVSAKDCDHGFWLRQIAWVPQRVELMPLSLRENLTLGIGEKSDDEVAEALSAASAFDFVEELPDRLDTRVGRRGRRLSEGQMQRIGIARALLRKPKLLLLDEPTSSLDPESAEQIRSVLKSLRGSVTIIAVAHSENIVEIADRSVELKNRNFYANHKHQR
jgi:ABC-type multidrug transport system fused ATPase/permease subunit